MSASWKSKTLTFCILGAKQREIGASAKGGMWEKPNLLRRSGEGLDELRYDGLDTGVIPVQVLGQGAHDNHDALPHSIVRLRLGDLVQEALKQRQKLRHHVLKHAQNPSELRVNFQGKVQLQCITKGKINIKAC